ncbi:MAG: hypothetical protein V1733_06520 [bacterium]
MKSKLYFLTLGIFLSLTNLVAQDEVIQKGLRAINPVAIKAQLDFLSSDWMEGRNTGEKGSLIAADYIASLFAACGLKPGGEMKEQREAPCASWERQPSKRVRSFFQDFNLIKYREGDVQSMSVNAKPEGSVSSVLLNFGTDYKVRIPTTGMEFTAPLVFVGYGIRDKESGWDDFADIDVKGKIVIRVSGYPGKGDSLSKGYKAFSSRIDSREHSPLTNRDDWVKEALAVIDIPERYDPQDRWSVNDPDRDQTSGFHCVRSLDS